ncbi:MAG: hypothetical protein FWF43_04495 [Propionibacteriaceae bacterium]|nr:hypothetical protein [Propionibacteriaceae bacterium]
MWQPRRKAPDSSRSAHDPYLFGSDALDAQWKTTQQGIDANDFEICYRLAPGKAPMDVDDDLGVRFTPGLLGYASEPSQLEQDQPQLHDSILRPTRP